ncbi:MAG: phage holin family protein [Clostridiales bacterium]|nr:phage holin family protein [Clostridiales bacterium]
MINETAMKILVAALLSVFGALARLLNQKDKTPLRLSAMISGCLVAAFSGVMAHFLAEFFESPPNLSYVIAGISGWIGPHILDVFANLVMKNTGLKS